MRLVLQRVSHGAVTWAEGKGEIGEGFVIFIGVGPEDTEEIAGRMAEKACRMRVFADGEGRMNRSLEDIGGAALVVSQFTLYADLSRGRRPSFVGAAEPATADLLYRSFAEEIRSRGLEVRTGSFGAEMRVELTNVGPVTIVISSDDWPTRASGVG